MAEKKQLNPLLLVLGVVAGAVGAILMTDEKARKNAKEKMSGVTKKGSATAKSLWIKLKEFISDAEALNSQTQLDEGRSKKGIKKAKK